MDFVRLVNEVKMSSNEEVQSLAASYGIHFSVQEIENLRPLVDEVSFHWFFTGVPQSFIYQVQQAIGVSKTNELFAMYQHYLK